MREGGIHLARQRFRAPETAEDPDHPQRNPAALDVLPLALQGEGRVGVRGPGDVLLDDRTLVQIGRDVVGGGADELDTAVVRLVVGLGALEAGQEGVVDIDDSAMEALAQGGGEDLHVASQNHELHAQGVDQADPSRVEYPIPGNDDAIKGLQLLADYFVQAIAEGKNKEN